jgi:hypothetical protein
MIPLADGARSTLLLPSRAGQLNSTRTMLPKTSNEGPVCGFLTAEAPFRGLLALSQPDDKTISPQ